MRTTINLDDEVYAAARMRAFHERRSLGAVVSELVRRGLAAEQQPVLRFGAFEGLIHIAEDFDETPPDVVDALDAPLS